MGAVAGYSRGGFDGKNTLSLSPKEVKKKLALN